MFYPLLCFLVLFQDHWAKINASDSQDNVCIEAVTPHFQLAEGPHWDYKKQILYFVDIMGQKLCRYDPATGATNCIYIENGPCGVGIPVDYQNNEHSNKFVVGTGTDFTLVEWDFGKDKDKTSTRVLATVDKDHKGTRWNDGKADSRGRFWGGTMGPEVNGDAVPNQGTFYLIDSDLTPQVKITPVSVSNGLAWNLENNILYYIDTPTRKVVAYNYDAEAGTISNKTTVFDFEKHNVTGLPDGMTIDTDGNLWIATFNGHHVIQIDPRTDKLLCKVRIPASRVTSVAFGGKNLDILYVTTSQFGLTEEQLKSQPEAGRVFAVTGLGVHGMPANYFKL